jgi:galactokinase
LIGAGFGGCTLTLLEKSAVSSYLAALKDYKAKFGYLAETYESGVTGGATVVWQRE